MNHRDFSNLWEETVIKSKNTLVVKGAEYAPGTDRLHNFKQAASLMGITPRQALGGMMVKHIVSVFDLINNEELEQMPVWDEKIGDSINYLILLKALVVEESST